jgi:hypothetical protein
MRRSLVPTTLALVLLLMLTSVATATTITFSATLKENFGREASAQPCVLDDQAQTITCFGFGSVASLGRVTQAIGVFDFSGETPTFTRTWVFSDGSTLVTSEIFGEGSTPGNSQNGAPGYGQPSFQTATWEVTGGTGRFANASGSGTSKFVAAGDTIVLTFSGSLTY